MAAMVQLAYHFTLAQVYRIGAYLFPLSKQPLRQYSLPPGEVRKFIRTSSSECLVI